MSTDAVTTVSVEIAGTEISFETGKMAKQAGGAVVVRQGDTMVLCTATVGNLRDVDFLPLTVDVEERMYAAGKIPGSFFKREGRAGEKGTLTARMIDRPIRPLFPKGWHFETQLVAMPLSVDLVNPYDILAMNGASAALMISPVPLPTPVGAVRIGKIDGNFVVNPPEESLLATSENPSTLDLVVAGTDEAILMVEAGAIEISEAEILDALDIAHDEIKKLCAAPARPGRQGRQGEDRRRGSGHRRGPARGHRVLARRAISMPPRRSRTSSTARTPRTPSRPRSIEKYAGDPDAADYSAKRSEASAAFAKIEKAKIRNRIAVDEEAPGRPLGQGDPQDLDRGRRHARARTARRSSRAARRRRSRSPRWAR